ncbi:hypothetical protein BCR32DRAFT_291624 [Anaeromyces robustus]|uniref:Uncharacterized protein n=1 Tax=Anaeromyces robustus TaxID=1754192 RepID=A0A1Y1XE72_9FUNG|nr:hypothetical protein BCR32DRAFT_291624 [Anaeromyces robustus]|eukprot:ORX84039.1 hypothetical protein BCR32DRAFT_291624 [Anaeromyces robustus]
MIFIFKKKFKIVYYVIFTIILSISSIYLTSLIIFKRSHNISLESYKKIYNPISSVDGFVHLSSDNINGPITVNRALDDGTKVDIYSLLSKNNYNFDEKIDNSNNDKIAIVMFAENVQPNSYAEHAISEFYQYANIHGYKFIYNNQRYDRDNELFYMKIHVITEAITEGLKEKKFNWIFWVDCDTVLANPSIKLEAFLPRKRNIHFIAADRNGINAGVFFIRVHPWSLNFMLRTGSHAYFNKDEYYEYGEETSFKKILKEAEGKEEEKFFALVPPEWFNTLPENKKRGDFILHPCFRKKESQVDIYELRKEVQSDKKYISGKSTKKLRRQVKNFYRYSKWK